jgi:hypothetical protein
MFAVRAVPGVGVSLAPIKSLCLPKHSRLKTDIIVPIISTR